MSVYSVFSGLTSALYLREFAPDFGERKWLFKTGNFGDVQCLFPVSLEQIPGSRHLLVD